MKTKFLYRLLPIVIGAIAGFAYYNFIGCNGSCPISGSPYVSTLYGAGCGLLWVLPNFRRKSKD